VGDAPVQEVGPSHSLAQSGDAGRHLGHHPRVEAARRQHGLQVVDRDLGDERRRIVDVPVETGHVGQVDQLLRLEGGGDGAGHGVGVDVVGLAGFVHADGGHHRHQLLVDLAFQHRGVDVADVTHESQPGIPGHHCDQAGVLAREPDGIGPVPVDGPHHLAVDLAHQGHTDDVDGLGVSHPQAVDEDRLLAQAPHQIGDLGAAAVDDDRVHAHPPHEGHVPGEEVDQVRGLGGAPLDAGRLGDSPHPGLGHGVAAVFDDHGAARELADVGQRLGQHGRLGPRFGHHAHDVLMFSSM
jgi:hypothetical protein